MLSRYTCMYVHRYPFTADQSVPDCDWETFLRETANLIVEQQSPQRYVGGVSHAPHIA